MGRLAEGFRNISSPLGTRNIIDLVDAPNMGQPVRVFASERKLSEYTIKWEKFFPRHNAYADGLLRFLLRRIQICRLLIVPASALELGILHSNGPVCVSGIIMYISMATK